MHPLLTQWTWLYSVLCLVGATGAATLHRAYTETGDAGLKRFIEKYPRAKRFSKWTGRWPQCRAALLLCWAGLLLGAVYFALGPLSMAPPLIRWGWALTGLALVTLHLHIIPAAAAESYSDRLTLATLPWVIAWTTLWYPLAIVVATLEKVITRSLRTQSTEDHRPSSEDEIISLVDDTDSADLEDAEREMIRSVLEFGDTVTREIMTHRVEVVAFAHDSTIAQCVERSKESRYSRFPVFAGNLDDVRGIVHVKDLLRSLSEGNGDQTIATLCNTALFVPESMPVDDLFRQLRAVRAQLAMVVDEYGGTAGIVSMEDIIEEIVGEIHDEYDAAEIKIQSLPDASYLINAREPVYEINEALAIHIPESDEYDSLGGFIFQRLGQIPTAGERIELDDVTLTVQTAEPNRVVNVRLTKKDPATAKED